MPTAVYDPKQDDDKLSHASNPGATYERDMLEDMYNAPSASSSGSEELSRRELARKERMEEGIMRGYGQDINKSEKDAVGKAANPDEQSNSNPADDTVGKGYKGSKDGSIKAKAQQKKRRKVVGWVAAIVLSLGSAVGVGGTLAGPGQFIQAANQLRPPTMGDAEDTADNRLFMLARYIREPNKPQNLRMGILANKYADKIETRLNQGGVQSTYTEKLGFLNGYNLDKSKFRGDLAGLKGASDAEIKEYFKNNYGVDVEIKGKTMFVSGEQLSFKQQRVFVGDILQMTGSGKVSGAVQARVMGKRAGIDWHPMKGNNKTLRSVEARYLKWKEERKLKISQGSDAIKPTVDKKPNPQGGDSAAQNADNVESNINETQAQADEGRTTGDMSELNGKMEGIKTGAVTGVSAVAVVCLLHGIAVNVDNVEQAQVVKPMVRIYGDILAMGNQIMFGDGDVDVEQMGFMQKQMYDPKTKTSWDQAAPIQAMNGQNQSGPDLDKSLRPSGENAVVRFFGSIPGLEATCEAASTTTGQVVMTLAGGLTIANAVITGAFLAFGDQAIDTLSHWIAGDPVNPDASGAQLGAMAAWGGKYAQRDMGSSMGGRELNGTETLEVTRSREQKEEHDFKQKSLAYRLFETTDNRTLVGSIIGKQRPDAQANMAAFASNILNFGNTIMSAPQNLFSKKAGAVRPYSWSGLKDIGYAVDELDSPLAKENPYTSKCKVIGCPQENITGILEGEEGSKQLDRVKACFGLEISLSDGAVTSTGQMPTDKDRRENNCNQRFDTSSKCEERSAECDWARIRFYILDMKTLDGYTCYLGDNESCQMSDFDSSNETSYAPSEVHESIAYSQTPNHGARS